MDLIKETKALQGGLLNFYAFSHDYYSIKDTHIICCCNISLHKRKSVLAPVAHTAQHENHHPKNCTLWLKQKVQPSFKFYVQRTKSLLYIENSGFLFFLPNNFVITKPPNYRIIRQLIAHVYCLWSKRSSENKCPYSHVPDLLPPTKFTENQKLLTWDNEERKRWPFLYFSSSIFSRQNKILDFSAQPTEKM